MPFSRFFPADLHPALAALAQILWLVQIALVIHVYRTGRPYWWTWVLFAAPGIGGLAYFILEILPSVRSPRGLWYSLKPRKWRIADLRRELEESETVENRLALAEELFDAGELKEAHDIAEECLQGVFKNDPHTMVEVAHYKLAVKDYEGAHALLEAVDTTADRMLAVRVQLYTADSLVGLGDYDTAEELYRSLLNRHVGEAPRAGLATICERRGRLNEAAAYWKEIRVRFRKANPAWRRTERPWYRLATNRLKALRRAPAA